MPVVNSGDGGVEATLSHDIPEASPEMNDEYEANSSKSAASPSRRKAYFAIGLLALIVITLCIVLPLTLGDSGNGNGSAFDSSADMISANANANDNGAGVDVTTEEKDATVTATTPTTTTEKEDEEEVIELTPENAATNIGAGSDTYSFSTTSSSGTATETETETAESTKTPSATVNKEGDDVPDKDAETTVGAGAGAIDAGDGSSGTALLVGPDATLPLWGSGLTDGYSDDNEFERALIIAFRQQANTIIEQNIRNYEYQQQWEGGYGGDARPPPMAMPMDSNGDFSEMAFDAADGGAPVPEAAGAANNIVADSGAAGGAGQSDKVTDFGTNNQEENIDEADLIKADANYVYASYGDYIIIWDTAGNKVGQVQMPPIPTKEGQGGGLEEEIHTEPQEGKPEVQTVSSSSNTKSVWAPDFHYQPKPHINSMLLTENHLVALVDGYNNDPFYWGMGNSPREHVMSSYRACQVRLYAKDTTTGGLNFLGSKDINGNFVDARSIGDVVHLMTASSVDTWTHLGYPLDYYRLSDGNKITLEEYTQLANQHADTVVPEIAKKFIEELRLEDGSLPTLLQVNQWMSHTNKTENSEHSTTTGPGFALPHYQSYDVVSNVGQVTSFNVNSPLQITTTESGGTSSELATTASAFLAPSYFNTLYGTDDYLVLATSGWDWNPSMQEGEQTTYVVALAIQDDDTTIFKSVGSLPGHLLNPYALDIVNDELRAATTVERFPDWWWGPVPMPGGGPVPFVDDVVTEEIPLETEPIEAAESEVGEATVVSGELEALHQEEKGGGNNRKLRHRHLEKGTTATKYRKLQTDCPTQESNSECVNDTNYAECMELKDSGCPEIAILESCPLQFACVLGDLTADTSAAAQQQGEDIVQDDEPDINVLPPPPGGQQTDPNEVSRTSNYMTVMKVIGEGVPAGQMSRKGQVKIGEKHERITSVRFFDNVAYAVTFERTDPFYVLDMNVPAVLGELKLPGFSSYLHSMNADNTLLLAVGQNATDDGRETGLMVTVFDATTPSEPKALVSHTFENDDSAYSGSSVQWDYKAFRYVDGKLVVPLEIWYSQQWDPDAQELLPIPEGAENFRGFAVLDVDTTAITEKYRISHMKPDGTCFYCDGGWVPQRSFVYAGDLMTVQEGVVVSTGLDSGEEKWRFTISVEGEPADCCW